VGASSPKVMMVAKEMLQVLQATLALQ